MNQLGVVLCRDYLPHSLAAFADSSALNLQCELRLRLPLRRLYALLCELCWVSSSRTRLSTMDDTHLRSLVLSDLMRLACSAGFGEAAHVVAAFNIRRLL